jgi:hypothetical protein
MLLSAISILLLLHDYSAHALGDRLLLLLHD